MRRILLIVWLCTACTAGFSQTTYTFTGNGNWSDTANWNNRAVPPVMLSKTDSVIISPSGNGECVLDVQQFIPDSCQLTVLPGKKFRLTAGLKTTSVKLSDRLHIIDSSQLQLTSDSIMLSAGEYEFTSDQPLPVINAGDYIAGTTGSGYLRKVTSVSYLRPAPGQPLLWRVLYRTAKAKITEVIENGGFTVTMPVDNRFESANNAGGAWVINLPDITYTNGPFELEFSEGQVTLNPKWLFTVQASASRISYIEMSTRNSSFNGHFRLTARASAAVSVPEEKKVLKSFSKKFLVFAGLLPVLIDFGVDLVLKYDATVSAEAEKTAVFDINNTLDLGVRYSNGAWSPVRAASLNASYTPEPLSGDANLNLSATIGPEFSVKLYSVVGPYFWVGLGAEVDANFAAPDANWDVTLNGFGRTETGVDASIFGDNILNYNYSWQSNKTELYKTPDSVIKVSGDDQQALFGEYCSAPLKVKVVDKLGLPQSNVPVYFTVTSGGGTVDLPVTYTNASGIAETLWQLGTIYGIKQEVKATVIKADGSQISQPVVFTAKTPSVIGQWALESFANGVTPGTLVPVYDSACPNILLYRYSILVDNYSLDSTQFSNYNEERVVSSGIGWDPQTCQVSGSAPVTDSVYITQSSGSYVVENNTLVYTLNGGGSASYGFQFLTFDRIRVAENVYIRR